MPAPVLYQWPANAKFGRSVPKNKFYEHATISTALRERFVAEVQKITWAYKLAEPTIHLRGTEAVPEIQVFVIDAKEEAATVGDYVLAAIDRAVKFPIIFEVVRSHGGGETRVVAADKTITAARTQVGPYFSTDWLPAGHPRSPLPPALDLAGLHAALLTPLLPLAARPGERLSEVTARISQTTKLQREIAALETKLRNEPQANRKLALRRELKDRQAALSGLL